MIDEYMEKVLIEDALYLSRLPESRMSEPFIIEWFNLLERIAERLYEKRGDQGAISFILNISPKGGIELLRHIDLVVCCKISIQMLNEVSRIYFYSFQLYYVR